MTLQEFTIYLDRQPTGEELDALYEAGFDDSAPETGNGHGLIHVSREADTLTAAILSAVEDAQRAGFTVVGIEDEDLITLKTIAERTGRTYESIRLLSTGKRGPGGFPPPLSGDGWALYSWTAVAVWLREHLGEDATSDEHARIIAAADHLLRARALVDDLTPLVSLTQRHAA